MLAANNRLRKAGDINRVYAKGRGVSTQGLGIKFLRTGLATHRLAVVVGKKVSKKAVVRNRIRRRLAEQVKDPGIKIPAGYDIILTAHEDLSELPTAELARRLGALLTKSAIIK